MLAWQDGGWERKEGNARVYEKPEFLVCSSANEDEDDTLIIGTAMEQEDALLTCKVILGELLFPHPSIHPEKGVSEILESHIGEIKGKVPQFTPFQPYPLFLLLLHRL